MQAIIAYYISRVSALLNREMDLFGRAAQSVALQNKFIPKISYAEPDRVTDQTRSTDLE